MLHHLCGCKQNPYLFASFRAMKGIKAIRNFSQVAKDHKHAHKFCTTNFMTVKIINMEIASFFFGFVYLIIQLGFLLFPTIFVYFQIFKLYFINFW
jgi:hypothetical protein